MKFSAGRDLKLEVSDIFDWKLVSTQENLLFDETRPMSSDFVLPVVGTNLSRNKYRSEYITNIKVDHNEGKHTAFQ